MLYAVRRLEMRHMCRKMTPFQMTQLPYEVASIRSLEVPRHANNIQTLPGLFVPLEKFLSTSVLHTVGTK